MRPRFAREVCEAAPLEARVEAAYRRGNLFAKRRQLMDAWGRFCAASPAKAEGQVVYSRLTNRRACAQVGGVSSPERPCTTGLRAVLLFGTAAPNQGWGRELRI